MSSKAKMPARETVVTGPVPSAFPDRKPSATLHCSPQMRHFRKSAPAWQRDLSNESADRHGARLREENGRDQDQTGHDLLDERIDARDVEAGVQNSYENDAENDAGKAADASANQHPADNGCRDRKKLVSLS